VDSTQVTIRTDPPGAWVFLNERRIDRSPVERVMAAVGPTLLRLERDGYKELTDTLDLKKDEPLDVSFTLVQRIGNLVVGSSPGGADIYLDGEKTGLQTPDTLRGLPAGGFRRVGLRLAEYAGYEWPAVRVQEDTTLALAHSFSKLNCQVTFETEPSGAQIVVDGTVEGRTPAVVFLSYGQHVLALKLPGYHPVENTVTLASASHTVHEALTKLPPGTLILKILPYADVHINGALQSREQSRYQTSLDPGQYQIELRNPNFDTYRAVVDIISNQTTEKTIDMRAVKDSR
jgi:hypothetical protein